MTIGKVAQLANVGVETIRFYGRKGLVKEPLKPTSGYRQYPAETVTRVRFIKRAQGLGFSLEEIKELLTLRLDSHMSRQEVRSRADAKVAELDERMASLRQMRSALARLSAACRGRSGSDSACPILESLDQA